MNTVEIPEILLLEAFYKILETFNWNERQILLDTITKNKTRLSKHIKNSMCFRIGLLCYEDGCNSFPDKKDWENLRQELLSEK